MNTHCPKDVLLDDSHRLTCVTTKGLRTTASMPVSEMARYIAGFGGAKQFRCNFNDAVKAVQPRPGLTRSMAVRLILDQQLAKAQSPQQSD
jgi:hypothetical protein